MDKSFAVRKAGSQRNLARLLGITPAAVSQWGATLPQLQVFRLKEVRPRWVAEWRRTAQEAQKAAT